jgi:phosphopentomutase
VCDTRKKKEADIQQLTEKTGERGEDVKYCVVLCINDRQTLISAHRQQANVHAVLNGLNQQRKVTTRFTLSVSRSLARRVAKETPHMLKKPKPRGVLRGSFI